MKFWIAVFVLVCGAFFMLYWFNPVNVYHREIGQLHSAVANNDDEQIDTILERTVCTGEWIKLERAVKSYVRNRFDSLDTMTAIYEDENIGGALNPELLKDEEMDFEAAIKYQEEAREYLLAAKAEYQKIETIDDAVKSLGSELNDQMLDIFVYDISGDFSDETMTQNVYTTFDMLDVAIGANIDALKLLSANRNAWSVSDEGALTFQDGSVEQQYEAILARFEEED